ncbi:MAG: hypothetical protein IPJ23_09645 [Ignavibacteriales bacterium]|nr:hypothetical protein [Ignavibacteriales bacterium]
MKTLLILLAISLIISFKSIAQRNPGNERTPPGDRIDRLDDRNPVQNPIRNPEQKRQPIEQPIREKRKSTAMLSTTGTRYRRNCRSLESKSYY